MNDNDTNCYERMINQISTRTIGTIITVGCLNNEENNKSDDS